MVVSEERNYLYIMKKCIIYSERDLYQLYNLHILYKR